MRRRRRSRPGMLESKLWVYSVCPRIQLTTPGSSRFSSERYGSATRVPKNSSSTASTGAAAGGGMPAGKPCPTTASWNRGKKDSPRLVRVIHIRTDIDVSSRPHSRCELGSAFYSDSFCPPIGFANRFRGSRLGLGYYLGSRPIIGASSIQHFQKFLRSSSVATPLEALLKR